LSLHLIELDGDQGLVGEDLHELNLLRREGSHLAPSASDYADYDIPSQRWHSEMVRTSADCRAAHVSSRSSNTSGMRTTRRSVPILIFG
jgi:hypothetical protein